MRVRQAWIPDGTAALRADAEASALLWMPIKTFCPILQRLCLIIQNICAAIRPWI